MPPPPEMGQPHVEWVAKQHSDSPAKNIGDTFFALHCEYTRKAGVVTQRLDETRYLAPHIELVEKGAGVHAAGNEWPVLRLIFLEAFASIERTSGTPDRSLPCEICSVGAHRGTTHTCTWTYKRENGQHDVANKDNVFKRHR